MASRDLFLVSKWFPLREEKRWDVGRWEQEYAQVRDGAQRVEGTLLDNSTPAETSASVCSRDGVQRWKKMDAADLFVRKLEEGGRGPLLPAQRVLQELYVLGGVLLQMALWKKRERERERINKYTFISPVSKQHITTQSC